MHRILDPLWLDSTRLELSAKTGFTECGGTDSASHKRRQRSGPASPNGSSALVSVVILCLFHRESFDDVAHFHIVVTRQADATFEAFFDLGGVVLEAAKTPELALEHHDIVP